LSAKEKQAQPFRKTCFGIASESVLLYLFTTHPQKKKIDGKPPGMIVFFQLTMLVAPCSTSELVACTGFNAPSRYCTETIHPYIDTETMQQFVLPATVPCEFSLWK
jgi:hypothetical protein